MSAITITTLGEIINEHELQGRTLSLLKGDTAVSTVEIGHVLDLKSRVLLCPINPSYILRPLVLRPDARVEYLEGDPGSMVVTERLTFGEERWRITA